MRRDFIGVRLALLGDPDRGDGRKGTGLREDGLPDIDWCAVDGGEVTIEIRADPTDPLSGVLEKLTRTADRFWIARYPVTVAQFQAFLRACYRNGRWYLPEVISELFSVGYAPPKHRARYSNQPADSVNWYDAFAFCRWLSEQLGHEVWLPTEFEWQQAAIGGDPSVRYPWAQDGDPVAEPWRANTFESQLGRSTAVGLYPEGASPVGALDMAGTVWEWCLNPFDDPDGLDSSDPAKTRRAMRGGSWVSNQQYARASFRDWCNPFGRYHDVGFRLVCASPIFRTAVH